MDISFTRNFDPDTGKMRDQGRKRNIVEFFTAEEPMEGSTATHGRPIFKEYVVIRIIVPGDQRSMVERRATDDDKEEYPREWQAYLRQEALVTEGQPIEHWAPITRSLARQLKNANIHTVEALAGLSMDQGRQTNILGIQSLIKRATVYIEHAEKGAVPLAMVDENDALKREVERLKGELVAVNARYEQVLRESGKDVSTALPGQLHASVHVPAIKAPAPATSVIPKNWQALPDKELFKFIKSTFGQTVSRRTEAEEIIKEHEEIGSK